jgi:hypothetical protein
LQVQVRFDGLFRGDQVIQRMVPLPQLTIRYADPAVRHPLREDALPRASRDPTFFQPPGQRMLAAGMQQAVRREHERRLCDVQPVAGGAVAADDLADSQLLP